MYNQTKLVYLVDFKLVFLPPFLLFPRIIGVLLFFNYTQQGKPRSMIIPYRSLRQRPEDSHTAASYTLQAACSSSKFNSLSYLERIF